MKKKKQGGRGGAIQSTQDCARANKTIAMEIRSGAFHQIGRLATTRKEGRGKVNKPRTTETLRIEKRLLLGCRAHSISVWTDGVDGGREINPSVVATFPYH